MSELNFKLLKKFLELNKIHHAEIKFNGAGDSGAIDEIALYDKNNNQLPEKILKMNCMVKSTKDISVFNPKVEKWMTTKTYSSLTMEGFIEKLSYEVIEIPGVDWYNNEGGGGTVDIDFSTEEIKLYICRYEDTSQYDEEGEIIGDFNTKIAYEYEGTYDIKEIMRVMT